jgi:tetratricopeptide (TPR) repeat protein
VAVPTPPDQAEGLYASGLALWEDQDRPGALALLERAAALQPERTEIGYNLGVLLRELDRFGDAAAVWRDVVSRAPDHGDAWLNLGWATERTADASAALQVYEAGLARLPADRGLLFNRAELLQRRGAAEAALAGYQALLERHPGFAPGWVNAGMALKRLGALDTAERFYRRAIEIDDPGSTARAWFNLSNLLLLQGRWQEGWAAYEWRLRLPGAPALPWSLPRWTGAEPAGCRVLLWADQGFGDTIQFLRYAEAVARRDHRVILFASDLLTTLGASVPGIEQAVGLSRHPPDCDVQLAVSSLPYALGAGGPLWPGRYLASAQRMELPTRPGTRRVGLVWAGNPAQVNDANRSLHLADFAPLLEVPGIAWYSLQVGARADELAASPWAGRIEDLGPSLVDFSAAAAAVEALDLLITVCTAPAHLAGALDRPAWVLLPAIEPCWRWGLGGETTSWYPSLRLFRPARPEDRETEIRRMAALLSGGAPR